jgi:peptide/nickel transport system substrate-binding protein
MRPRKNQDLFGGSVKSYVRPSRALGLAIIAAFALAACGGASGSSSSAEGSPASATSTSASRSFGGSGGTVTLLMGAAPRSLDPGRGYSTQDAEVDWLVYTGLTTYKHASGRAGTTLIPGLATALPKISDDGRTYTATLRKGLKYSNGKPVKASDFPRAVERAIKIPWGGSAGFITPIIAGAAAYSIGKAKDISGITTDDSSGKITIHLTQAYGPFENVLAFPAMGMVPSSAPLKEEPANPPPGVGPYRVTNIVLHQSFSVIKNTEFRSIAGIPTPKVNVNVKISTNVTANALSVLNNSADVFDYADTVPVHLLPQIRATAPDRFSNVDLGGATFYIFFNVTNKPFDDQLAREAVVAGLNEDAMSRLAADPLDPGCYMLPPAVPGHPSAPCPYGTPGTGDLAKAKTLVKQSGMAGSRVTVWSPTGAPRHQWMAYYTALLNAIGFKATQRVLADANYFTAIGTRKLHPQTGFADWNEDFANPIDFYLLLDGHAILPDHNENFGEVNDPKINSAIASLGEVPSAQLSSVTPNWQAIDAYVAKQAYIGVFGYPTFPKFTSSRMDYRQAVFHPLYGWDLSTLAIR